MKGKIVQLDLRKKHGHILEDQGFSVGFTYDDLPEEQVSILRDSIGNARTVSMVLTDDACVFSVALEESEE